MACHWLANGLEIESASTAIRSSKELEETFKKLSTRKRKWHIQGLETD